MPTSAKKGEKNNQRKGISIAPPYFLVTLLVLINAILLLIQSEALRTHLIDQADLWAASFLEDILFKHGILHGWNIPAQSFLFPEGIIYLVMRLVTTSGEFAIYLTGIFNALILAPLTIRNILCALGAKKESAKTATIITVALWCIILALLAAVSSSLAINLLIPLIPFSHFGTFVTTLLALSSLYIMRDSAIWSASAFLNFTALILLALSHSSVTNSAVGIALILCLGSLLFKRKHPPKMESKQHSFTAPICKFLLLTLALIAAAQSIRVFSSKPFTWFTSPLINSLSPLMNPHKLRAGVIVGASPHQVRLFTKNKIRLISASEALIPDLSSQSSEWLNDSFNFIILPERLSGARHALFSLFGEPKLTAPVQLSTNENATLYFYDLRTFEAYWSTFPQRRSLAPGESISFWGFHLTSEIGHIEGFSRIVDQSSKPGVVIKNLNLPISAGTYLLRLRYSSRSFSPKKSSWQIKLSGTEHEKILMEGELADGENIDLKLPLSISDEYPIQLLQFDLLFKGDAELKIDGLNIQKSLFEYNYG